MCHEKKGLQIAMLHFQVPWKKDDQVSPSENGAQKKESKQKED